MRPIPMMDQVRQRWKRREAGLSYYESPNFSGFQVLAAFSSGNAAADQATATTGVDSSQNIKPRVQSLAALYHNGGLGIGVAYERHQEFGVWGTTATAGDDRGWGVSASYKFAGPKLKIGATYLDQKYETGPGSDLGKKTWTIGAEWNIAGPHSLEAQYANAGDSTGNSTVGISTNAAPCPGGVCRSDTGGQDYSIAYVYAFSKRTDIRLGYHKQDNDNNASYKLGNTCSANPRWRKPERVRDVHQPQVLNATNLPVSAKRALRRPFFYVRVAADDPVNRHAASELAAAAYAFVIRPIRRVALQAWSDNASSVMLHFCNKSKKIVR